MAQIHSGVDTKVDRPTPKIPPDQWLIQLLKSLTTPQQRTIALFMSFTGCRVGEACKVLVKHYDPERGRVFIEKTKTGDAREAVLTELVNRAMQLLDRSDPNARFFGYAIVYARPSNVPAIVPGLITTHRTSSGAMPLPTAFSQKVTHSNC